MCKNEFIKKTDKGPMNGGSKREGGNNASKKK